MSDLQAKVLSWIRTQGYPLEMECHRILKAHNFSCTVSPVYIDLDERKRREIDLFATKQYEKIDGFYFDIALAIECKYAKKRPWVVFCHKNENSVFLPNTGFFFSKYCKDLFTILRRDHDWKKKIKEFAFLNPKMMGSGVVESFKDETNDDDYHSYKALTTALKASLFTIKRTNDRNQEVDRKRPLCRLAIPTVIIEGELFRSFLSDDGEIMVENTECASIYWQSYYEIEGLPYINLVTKAYLPKYLNEIDEFTKYIFGICERKSDPIAAALMKVFLQNKPKDKDDPEEKLVDRKDEAKGSKGGQNQ